MGRDLRIKYNFNNTYDIDGYSLDVIESFFIKSWPKWYEKKYKKDENFFFNYSIKINRKTLIKLYYYIDRKEYLIDLPDYYREYLLNIFGYILSVTSKTNKIAFEFW